MGSYWRALLELEMLGSSTCQGRSIQMQEQCERNNIQSMYYFQKFKTYLQNEKEEQEGEGEGESKKELKSSDSYQLIMMDIIGNPDSDLEKSDVFQELICEEEECHEELENMYMKDFIFVNKLEEGRELSLEEWDMIIKEGNLSLVPKKNIYFSVFKGIKFSVRKHVWELFANTSQMKKKASRSYQELRDPDFVPPETVSQIDKDVPRSRSTTKYLKELRNILIAYSAYSGKDYTQGMNLIAGSLLTLLSLENDEELEEFMIVEKEFEERVFWVFIGVMVWKNWESIFERNLGGLTERLEVLESLMIEHIPAVYQKIIDFEWDLTIFSQYYITIMLYNTPVGFSKIILDLFFLDGEKVLHSLIIRMMKLQEDAILACMEEGELMNYFKKEMITQSYLTICSNQVGAKKLEDFQINFMKVNKP